MWERESVGKAGVGGTDMVEWTLRERDGASRVTLCSGWSPLQSWRVPGPFPTLWLPGPAGGDAGCQQLQGSSP